MAIYWGLVLNNKHAWDLALIRRLNELDIGDNMHSYNTPQNVLTLLNIPFYIITSQFSDPEIISILLLTLSKMTRTIKKEWEDRH